MSDLTYIFFINIWLPYYWSFQRTWWNIKTSWKYVIFDIKSVDLVKESVTVIFANIYQSMFSIIILTRTHLFHLSSLFSRPYLLYPTLLLLLANFMAGLFLIIILMPSGTPINIICLIINRLEHLTAWIMLFICGFILGYILVALWTAWSMGESPSLPISESPILTRKIPTCWHHSLISWPL